jgi:two-component system, NarL family, sensor histidine kinase UhpB
MSSVSDREFVPRSGRDRRRSLRWSLDVLEAFERAREEERRRLALELHDDLGQALTGMKMDLSWLQTRAADPSTLQTSEVVAKIDMTLQLLDQCLSTVRSVISDLRPKALDDLGLIGALEWQTETFSRRYGIRATFASGRDQVDLDPGRATSIFRMFQEMLTNVARHARATRVAVQVAVADETLVLTVRDNGRGLADARPLEGGYGMLGMRERTLLLGGRLEVVVGRPRGTTIVVAVPLVNRRRAARKMRTEP